MAEIRRFKIPFSSKAQQGYMHAHPEILGKKGLKEWDDATNFKHLPEKVSNNEYAKISYSLSRKARKK